MAEKINKTAIAERPEILSKRFTITLADKSELSFEKIRELVQAAIDKLYPPDANAFNYAWIKDLFPDYAIVDRDGKLTRIPYTIMGDQAMLGVAMPVEVEYVQASVARVSPLANAGEDTGATASRAPDTKSQFSFISLLSAIDDAGVVRIPILVTGQWVKGGRDVSFTRAELETAIENFNKLANHDLNVDYDHACEDLERAAGEPTPSAGRILSLDQPEPFKAGDDGKPRWILYGRYEPTARARTLIKNREYRYVSAAFAREYPDRKTGDSQGLTLTSVALTNQPFLDELPEIWLSISGEARRTAEPEHRAPSSQIQSRLSAEDRGGRSMKTLTIKHSVDADGKHKHEVYDGDNKVGELDHDELCQYSASHLGRDGAALSTAAASDAETLSRKTIERFTSEIGAEGKSKAEIRGLVALAISPPKAEITLLSECITEEGRLDDLKLNTLDDSGSIARSGYRRAQDAMNRVDRAYQRGQITPAMLVTGAPLRLALSDGAAFKALIEDRPSLVKVNTVVGMGGTGSESNESPRVLFSRLVEERKQKLMEGNSKLNELEAHRQASALISKENPEMLKNYRNDSQGPARA